MSRYVRHYTCHDADADARICMYTTFTAQVLIQSCLIEIPVAAIISVIIMVTVT